MKIAVFDHICNTGGGSRFIEQLLISMSKIDSELKIDFYCSPLGLKRETFAGKFKNNGISIKELNSLKLLNHFLVGKIVTKFGDWIENKFNRRMVLLGNVEKEIQMKAVGYDVAFFPWPFLLGDIKLKCPKVGVFHDLNFRYFFGVSVFSALQEKKLYSQISEWLKTTHAIVSTNFMKDEIEKHYKNHTYPIEVIHLAPLVEVLKTDETAYKKLENKFKLKKPYLIYPTHLCAHKNINSVVAAIAHVNTSGKKINIVFVGNGTEQVNGIATKIGLEKIDCATNQDVFGIGYISNKELNCLFDNCHAIISASLYEAGNGPGLDGWVRGKPVLMSDIPSFMEHLEVQNVKAITFDPLNYKDISNAILYLLNNYNNCLEDARQSRININKITWENVATQYINVFKKVINE